MSRESPQSISPPQGSRHHSLGSDANIRNFAPVARIMKMALPENAKIAKEAKECMQECVSEFISFITSEGTFPFPPRLFFPRPFFPHSHPPFFLPLPPLSPASFFFSASLSLSFSFFLTLSLFFFSYLTHLQFFQPPRNVSMKNGRQSTARISYLP